MPSREPRERFTLTIQDAGDPNRVPVAPRLRRLLKAMLRGYGLRCTDIRPVVDPAQSQETAIKTVAD